MNRIQAQGLQGIAVLESFEGGAGRGKKIGRIAVDRRGRGGGGFDAPLAWEFYAYILEGSQKFSALHCRLRLSHLYGGCSTHHFSIHSSQGLTKSKKGKWMACPPHDIKHDRWVIIWGVIGIATWNAAHENIQLSFRHWRISKTVTTSFQTWEYLTQSLSVQLNEASKNNED